MMKGLQSVAHIR